MILPLVIPRDNLRTATLETRSPGSRKSTQYGDRNSRRTGFTWFHFFTDVSRL